MVRELHRDSAVQRQKSNKHSTKTRIHARRTLIAALWNVRTLVESAGGDRRVSRSRPQSTGPGASQSSEAVRQHLVDRKLDIFVKELKCYGVSVAAVQETKWFGKDIRQADGYTFIHSGRPLPSEGESALRNEGVGIALDKRGTAAWKEAGEVWEAVSSRVLTIRMKL